MPTVYGASDFRQALQIAGVSVTVGAVTAKGLLDAPDERMLQGELTEYIGRSVSVLVETGVFALTSGGAITVDGSAYKILAFEQIDDGVPTRIAIASVT